MKLGKIKSPRLFASGLLLALVVGVLDQLSKWIAFGHLAEAGEPVSVTPFLNLVMVWNTGVSFGMLSQGIAPAFLTGVALVISMALLIWLARAQSRLTALAIGAVIGGAIGNVIDRLRFGAVADFVDLYVGAWHWPAFNVADAAIVVGAGVLIIEQLLGDKK